MIPVNDNLVIIRTGDIDINHLGDVSIKESIKNSKKRTVKDKTLSEIETNSE